MRALTHKLLSPLALSATITLTMAASPAGPIAPAAAAPACRSVSSSLSRQNASARREIRRLLSNNNYVPLVRTFVPKIERTVRFDGYGTIVVRSPHGTGPVAGAFELLHSEPCTIVITSASINLRRNAYILHFKAPGEQGHPGRIRITLVSS